MLLELSIESFALIDRLRLEPGGGLCVLSGETGAGKSIIIGALSAALGERAAADAVRTGAQQARLEAVFDIGRVPQAQEALVAAGLEPEEDGTLVLARTISREGRSGCWVNGRPTTLTILRSIGDRLVDIHGQHEHQALIREETHVEFVDVFGGPSHLAQRQAYAEVYGQMEATRQELEGLRLDEREKAQRLDLLRFQLGEIEAARLSPGEEEELMVERRRLANAEKLHELTAAAQRCLRGEEGEAPAAEELLGMAAEQVAGLVSLDDSLQPVQEQLAGALAAVAEASRELVAYAEQVEFNPGRLEQVEARLSEIARLKRKYGDTVEQVLEVGAQAAAAIQSMETSEQRLSELEARLENQKQQVGQGGEQLSAARQKLAKRLEKTVAAELAQLGMPKAVFKVEFGREAQPDGVPTAGGRRCAASERGLDQVRFLFCANPGEELKPLAKVASGGELSRLMLVFKSICSRAGEIPTLIFDEIDAGIGADTALAVGSKLVDVSARAQVLCVSHFPQIARMADRHIRVDKRTRGGRTIVAAAPLDEHERVAELARMLGGTEAAESAEEHARELLESARRGKRSTREAAA